MNSAETLVGALLSLPPSSIVTDTQHDAVLPGCSSDRGDHLTSVLLHEAVRASSYLDDQSVTPTRMRLDPLHPGDELGGEDGLHGSEYPFFRLVRHPPSVRAERVGPNRALQTQRIGA